MTDLDALESWVAPLLDKLQPAQRRKLAAAIARELRRSQSARIRAQQDPDGSPFQPRKPQHRQHRQRQGAIRRGPMFAKIRQAKHLRITSSPSAAGVGFTGRVARIARVHHYGLRDRVTPGGPHYPYPARPLIGISEADRNLVRDMLIDHLT
ncbi:MAG: phage virion morphogenesis protein [Porticoccaceae bacterium]